MKNAAFVLAVLLPAITCQARIIHVDALFGNDNNDGSSLETAFATIQKGVDSANDGDTVVVYQYFYTGDGNRDIDFKGKAITVRSTDPNDPRVVATTMIDCEGTIDDPHRGFSFTNNEEPNSVVAGLTIMNGYPLKYGSKYSYRIGGAIFCLRSSPTINNCMFIGNASPDYLGGAAIGCRESSPIISKCTFRNNEKGAISCNYSNPIITDCTFVGNSAEHGGGIYNSTDNSLTITNCVFIENSAWREGGGMFGNGTFTNCVFIENSAGSGGGMYGNGTLTDCVFIENSGGGMNGNGILTNCTFTGNSSQREGGGMYGHGTLTNCTFSGNSAKSGGGFYCTSRSGSTLTNCTFTNNSAQYNGGGMRGDGILTNCIFTGNSAQLIGGGMSGHGTLTNCTFSGNSAKDRGGGIFGSGILTNCTFSGNSAYAGGGMHGRGTLTNCTFSGNSAGRAGGGMSGSGTLTNCTFSGNSAGEQGGGMWGAGTLTSCTFNENLAEDNGGGIYCTSNSTLTNCILWDGGDEIWNNLGWVITVSYSDLQGGQIGIYDPCDAVFWGAGNIDADPCFADPGYWVDANDPNVIVEPNDPNAIWIDGDYHLKSQAGRWDPNIESWVQDDVTSPCIDRGDPMNPIGHEPFPNGGIINMGAFGGTAEGSKSYFGKPPCEIIVAGDINGDCEVNFLDFRLMALHWLQNNNP